MPDTDQPPPNKRITPARTPSLSSTPQETGASATSKELKGILDRRQRANLFARSLRS